MTFQTSKKHAQVLMPKSNTKMYKKIGLFIGLICFCFLVSCRATRQEVKKTETKIETTSTKVTTFRDTLVFAPKSFTSLKIPVAEIAFKNNLKADSKPKVFTQKNGNATAKIKVVHDTIEVTATCDSLAIVAKIKSEFEKQTASTEAKNIENIKQKTGYGFWDLFVAAALGFVICFFLKLFKII